MSGGRAETLATGLKALVGVGRCGCGGDADGGLGGGTEGGGGREGRDGDGSRLNWWGYIVAKLTLGKETNVPLAYAPVLEHHQLIMSTLGEPIGRLERDRETHTALLMILPPGTPTSQGTS